MASQLTEKEPSLGELAEQALAIAKKHGAASAAATTSESRSVDVTWRDGKLEQVAEATERSLAVELFVDGRYSRVSTSDLRPAAIDVFLADSVALARALAPDPARGLPEPGLYAARSSVDLDLEDRGFDQVTGQQRKDAARELVEAARDVEGKAAIASVSGGWSDGVTEMVRMASNGFQGKRRDTQFTPYAQVSVNDKEGRKQEEYAYTVARFRADIPALRGIGQEAARRSLSRIGQAKGKSEVLPMAVENRVGARLLAMLLQPLGGQALQQKQSFLDGQMGKPIGSKLLDLRDEPFLPRGMASRHFDGEGISAKPFAVFEAGVLKTYLIDTYYGRKLGVAPTTGSTSNMTMRGGDKGRDGLLAAMGEGIYVTGFLGGNSNGATGDYSLGIAGFRVRKGQLAEPIGEMNIGGNQRDLWKKLVAVGNDPWLAGSRRTPTLVFDGVQFAGT